MGSWIAKSFKTQPTVEVELNWQVSKSDNCYRDLQSCCKNCGLNRPNQHLQIWCRAKKEKKRLCFVQLIGRIVLDQQLLRLITSVRPIAGLSNGELSEAGMCNMFLRRSNCRVTSANISPCINLLLEFPCCRCCVLFSLQQHPH